MKQKLTGALSRLMPSAVSRSRLHRRTFQRFADKIDFVYFGYVDQRDDEHRLVRGLTLSPTHRDDHYSIGSYHGYDILFLERQDVIKQPGVPDETKQWTIMTADLHRAHNLPHIFIGQTSHSATFYRHVLTKFSYLQKHLPGSVSTYDPRFNAQFALYTTPAHALEAEQLFAGQFSTMLLEHFAGFSFEIHETTLYVYAESERPSAQLLAKMLQCTAWFATELDRR